MGESDTSAQTPTPEEEQATASVPAEPQQTTSAGGDGGVQPDSVYEG